MAWLEFWVGREKGVGEVPVRSREGYEFESQSSSKMSRTPFDERRVLDNTMQFDRKGQLR